MEENKAKKTFQDFKANVEARWIAFTYRAEMKIRDAAAWAAQNKEIAIAMIPVALYGAKMVGNTVKSVNRKMDLKKEQELQDLYVYDHSLGMYHKLRRPMKPSEKIELDRRRNEGETKIQIQILASMGLLD